MHPELQRLLLAATVNRTHLSYKRGRWTDRCAQCGMCAARGRAKSSQRWCGRTFRQSCSSSLRPSPRPRHGWLNLGVAGPGMAGKAGQGTVWHGMAGKAGQGTVWHGMAGKAGHGRARQG